MSIRKAVRVVGFAVAASLFAAVCATPDTAWAQSAVSGTGKGIAGGALIGGEIGFLTLSAAGAKQGWMYVVVPGALAIGGGIAGRLIENSAKPEIPLYMLAGGLALIIPTVVITLSANAYKPSNTEDATPSDATPADAARPPAAIAPSDGGGAGAAGGGASPAPPVTPPKPEQPKPTSSLAPESRPFALVNVSHSYLTFAMPVVAVAPAYTRVELEKYGLAQHYEVHAPLLAVAF